MACRNRSVSCSLLKLAPFLLLSGEYLTPADGLWVWEFSHVSHIAHKDGKWAIFPLLPFSCLKISGVKSKFSNTKGFPAFLFLYIVHLWVELLKLLFKIIWLWLHRGLLVLQHPQAAVQYTCEAEMTNSTPAPCRMLWCTQEEVGAIFHLITRTLKHTKFVNLLAPSSRGVMML